METANYTKNLFYFFPNIKKHEVIRQGSLMFLFMIVFNCCLYGQNIKKYEKYIAVMDHIETHYDFRIEIYKDVWDSQIYCSINNESRKLLDDPVLMEKMKENKIFSIDVFPNNKIEIEIDTTPFFEKRKFITRYLSENTEKVGVLIDKDTFFAKSKPNTY